MSCFKLMPCCPCCNPNYQNQDGTGIAERNENQTMKYFKTKKKSLERVNLINEINLNQYKK